MGSSLLEASSFSFADKNVPLEEKSLVRSEQKVEKFAILRT